MESAKMIEMGQIPLAWLMSILFKSVGVTEGFVDFRIVCIRTTFHCYYYIIVESRRLLVSAVGLDRSHR